MAVSNLAVAETYPGDGSTTSFLIPFAFMENTQVQVLLTNLETEAEEILVQGTGFTVTGGDPGTHVETVDTYDSDYEITVYRETEKTQEAEDIDTGNFRPESFEDALDKLTMIVQELSRSVGLVESSSLAGDGALIRLADQSVAAVGTVTVGTNQRMLKNVQGSGGAVTASTSTPIADGSIDGQELILEGLSDTDTLTISDQGNVDIGGDITFYEGTVLGLYWNDDRSKWVSNFRKE